MRFTAASVALFAGLAAAVPQGEAETLYSTEDVTITSCGPTVTDCPSRQTSTPQGVEAVTSSTPSAVPTSSATPSSSPVAPVEVPSNTPSSSSPVAPVQPSSTAPVVPVQVPTSSASVIPVTTCVPTVTYSTVQVPATAPARPSGASPRGGSSSAPVIPVAVPSGSSSARYVIHSCNNNIIGSMLTRTAALPLLPLPPLLPLLSSLVLPAPSATPSLSLVLPPLPPSSWLKLFPSCV